VDAGHDRRARGVDEGQYTMTTVLFLIEEVVTDGSQLLDQRG
jgi:hypothetical protein